METEEVGLWTLWKMKQHDLDILTKVTWNTPFGIGFLFETWTNLRKKKCWNECWGIWYHPVKPLIPTSKVLIFNKELCKIQSDSSQAQKKYLQRSTAQDSSLGVNYANFHPWVVVGTWSSWRWSSWLIYPNDADSVSVLLRAFDLQGHDANKSCSPSACSESWSN